MRFKLLVMAMSMLLCGCSTTEREVIEAPPIEWDPPRYTCARTTGPIQIDGKLDEPDWRSVPRTREFGDIRGPGHPRPAHTTRASMLWDDDYLYVGAALEEPHVWATLTERDSVIYYDDDFEVFIDPDGDTHEYYELEINALGTEWDLFLGRPYRDGGPADHDWNIEGLISAVQVDGTLNDPGDTDRGWVVEIAFPWAALAEFAHRPSPPQPGDLWRLGFSRVDWEVEAIDGNYVKRVDPTSGKTLPENNWTWSQQGLIAMHYPEMWGFVHFTDTPADRLDPAASFELPAGERAGWALRRLYYAQSAWRADHRGYADDARQLDLGIETVDEFSWPPQITIVEAGYVALIHGVDGGSLSIDHEGRLRR